MKLFGPLSVTMSKTKSMIRVPEVKINHFSGFFFFVFFL